MKFMIMTLLVLGACDEITCHGTSRRIEVVGYESERIHVQIDQPESLTKTIQIPYLIPVPMPYPAKPVTAEKP